MGICTEECHKFISGKKWTHWKDRECLTAGVAQTVLRLATGGGKVFRTLPHRLWSTPSLLCNEYRLCFLRVKRPKRDIGHYPRLARRLESWNTPPFLLWAFMLWSGVKFYFGLKRKLTDVTISRTRPTDLPIIATQFKCYFETFLFVVSTVLRFIPSEWPLHITPAFITETSASCTQYVY
jgi:hypothetical protein